MQKPQQLFIYWIFKKISWEKHAVLSTNEYERDAWNGGAFAYSGHKDRSKSSFRDEVLKLLLYSLIPTSQICLGLCVYDLASYA